MAPARSRNQPAVAAHVPGPADARLKVVEFAVRAVLVDDPLDARVLRYGEYREVVLVVPDARLVIVAKAEVGGQFTADLNVILEVEAIVAAIDAECGTETQVTRDGYPKQKTRDTTAAV